MALVLTQNEKSAADVVYADQLGVSYEYPARYRSLIQPGEHFVYYRGKRRADGATQVPHYFGTGVIGEVTGEDGMYRCAIGDYQPFENVVPFKKLKKEPSPPGQKTATQLTELALKLAVAEVETRWPSGKIFVAPPNSEFSIVVRISKDDRRHIAVKSTTASEPLVRLTSDEIHYSTTHAATYAVWLFYELDLKHGTARFLSHDGRITAKDFDLEAALHGGELRTKKAGKKVGPVTE